MKQIKNIIIIVFATITLFGGCQKDEDPVTPPPVADVRGVYAGTVAFTSESGSLTVNVGSTLLKANEILPVTGVFKLIGGSDITISGTFNTANDSLHLSAGSYSFAGKYSGGNISGICIGPGGLGMFTLAVSTTSNPVKIYTGTFSVPNGPYGPFNLLISETTLSGIAIDVRENVNIKLSGTAQASTLNIVDPARGNLRIASGAISTDGSTASGVTYSSSGQQNGTWSGTLVQLQ